MKDNAIDLTKISSEVLDILKRLGLNPISFGVTIVLEKNEFEHLAEKHPNHILPDIILKTDSESNGVQWSIQILRKMISEDLPGG